MNGSRKPSLEACMELSYSLGNDIYIACGYQVPDPLISVIGKRWEDLTDEDKEKVIELVERLANAK
jgi:hypothetical protein